jgi:hypothetical protein
LLIGSYELSRLFTLRKGGKLAPGEVVRTVLPIALALAPSLALYLASPLAGESTPGTWDAAQKAFVIFAPFTVYSTALTVMTGAAFFMLLV